MSPPLHTPTTASHTPAWLRAAPALFLLLWSLGFPIAKIGLAHAEPITFLTLRYALVLVVLTPLFLWLRPPLPRGRAWLHLAVVGILIQGIYFGLTYTAFALGTSAGTVALVVSLQPVLIALLAPTLLGEVISWKGWIGFALGFVGAVLVVLARAKIEVLSPTGILCTVVALCAMVGATLYERRFGTAQHPVTANFVQYAAGLVVTLPLALTFETFQVAWAGEFVAALAYLAIGNSLIAITLLLAMVRHGKASQTSALFYLVPPCAALLAWLLIGEAMPPLAWVGMAVAAVGVALVTRKSPAAGKVAKEPTA